MNKSFTFNSYIDLASRPLREATQEEIKREPMLFQCNHEHAFEWGGDLTREFLRNLPVEWLEEGLRVDSRTHMLMPGWFPCIPGWHHDDVPRERADGQPNYYDPSYKSEHAMAFWGDCCPTEFAIGSESFPDVPMGGVYYKEWHPLVEQGIRERTLRRFTAPERRIIFFNWQSWHQGTAAKSNGWRFFIRATRSSTLPAKNERRTQVQVYLNALTEGW